MSADAPSDPLCTNHHNTTRKVYTFVPTQEWTRRGRIVTSIRSMASPKSEIAFIEGIVRPMEIVADLFDEDISDEGDDE